MFDKMENIVTSSEEKLYNLMPRLRFFFLRSISAIS